MVGISTWETEEDVASLTSSEENLSALAAETSTPSTSKTQYGKILETVWSAGGKLLPASERDNRAVYKAARG